MTVHTGHDAVVESAEMSQGSETKPTSRKMQDWPTLETRPYFESESVRLCRGDCLELLNQMRSGDLEKDDPFDAMVTDPPYCSGAATKSARDADPASKYCQNGNRCGRPNFEGDHRDARSFEFWCTMWLTLARRHCKTSAYGLVFIDWRQLPLMTSIIQASGFAWKGICVWNKGRASRSPHKVEFPTDSGRGVWVRGFVQIVPGFGSPGLSVF